MTAEGHPDKIRRLLKETASLLCLECGKCTGICPANRGDPKFSPRNIVKLAVLDDHDKLLECTNLWDCVSCNLCNEVCMSDVKLPEFIRQIRIMAKERGNLSCPTHAGVIEGFTALMEREDLRPKRREWIEPDMELNENSEVVLFTGCAPFYDVVFNEFDRTTDILKATVRIMNRIGIKPAVMENERCCGHDQYWRGEEDSFRNLMELNKKEIKNTKAKIVVTPCAECYWMIMEHYGLDIRVKHITQFLEEKFDVLVPLIAKNKYGDRKVFAYHDPCRLGRMAREFGAPRMLLEVIRNSELRALEHEREISQCCGVGAWINCTEGSRKLRESRLREAKERGADTLVTACPKCRIHLRCHESRESVPRVGIDIEDITVIIAKALGVWKDDGNSGKK
jgi:Fe-S oxidoreductase